MMKKNLTTYLSLLLLAAATISSSAAGKADVQAQLDQLAKGDWILQAQALKLLADSGSKSAILSIDQLVKNQAANAYVRGRALVALAKLDSGKAVVDTQAFAASADALLRAAAAEAYGYGSGNVAKAPLGNLLKDKDRKVAMMAIVSWARLYGKDAWAVVDPATKPLVNPKLPEDLWWKIVPAMHALAHTGTPDAYARINAIAPPYLEPSLRGLMTSGQTSVLPLAARHVHRAHHKQGEHTRSLGKGPAVPDKPEYRSVMAAVKSSGPEVIEATVRTLLQSTDPQDMVLACTMAAHMMPAPATGDILLKACGDADNANVDHACVQALTVPAMQPERYEAYFTSLLKSKHITSRIAGIDGLAACPKVNRFEAYSDIVQGGDSSILVDWNLDGSWIWHPDTDSGMNMPAGKRFFRKQIEIPEGNIERAVIKVTADNDFVLYVNGKEVGSGGNWQVVSSCYLRKHLSEGQNIIAIEAGNTEPGAAGLVVTLRIDFDKGKPLVIKTDSSWKSSSERTTEWQTIAFNDSDWSSARVLGPYGCEPWGSFAGAGAEKADAVLQAALEQLMLAPVEQAQGQKIGAYLYKAMAANNPHVRKVAAELFKKIADKSDYADVAKAWEALLYSKDWQLRDSARKTIATIATEDDLTELARSDGYITQWQVIGTFLGGESLEKTPAYPPETELDFSKTYEAEGIYIVKNRNNKIPPTRKKRTRTIEWLKGTVRTVDGLLRLNYYVTRPTKEAVAYAAATITPKTPGEAIIQIDGLVYQGETLPNLWLNGALAAAPKPMVPKDRYLWPVRFPWRHGRGTSGARATYKVTLKAGPNQILIKSLNLDQKMWDFRVRVLNPDGSPMEMEKGEKGEKALGVRD